VQVALSKCRRKQEILKIIRKSEYSSLYINLDSILEEKENE